MLLMYKWMLVIFGWNRFISDQPNDLKLLANQFFRIFSDVGTVSAFITMSVLTIIAVVLYYFWWTNGSSKHFKFRYRIRWWLLWGLVTSVLVMVVTPFVMQMLMQSDFHGGDKFYWAVSLCNLLYSIVIFFIGSVISQSFTKLTNASCTPFYKIKK